MPNVTANGIQIEYDTFGSRNADPLLLVMGLGAQMIGWDEEFCEMVAGRGHHVIRFDNRDVGLSTKLDHLGMPDMAAIFTARAQGKPVENPPYLLNDMADDAAALLEALGIGRAHIVGASMGGMIVQAMAIRHPKRVASMTSIMSTTGNPELPQAKPEAMAVLTTPAAEDREGRIAQGVAASRTIGSTGFPFDEERAKKRAAMSYDRCFYPVGMMRQMAAIMASPSRKEALRSVKAPSLVIHGDIDPLVPVEGGKDTAEAIPGAELLIIEGMGHDLPPGAWGTVVEAMARNAARG
ncbi:MAG: alpha/beta hydrolase [Chloroflexi bacterium]|nr:alpha/beta hydrolase [Chloroflexota bacterium]